MLALETLGKRWGWEKTKVWRFFRDHVTCFQLYRLPNSYGCVIYRRFYPTCDEIRMPEKEAVISKEGWFCLRMPLIIPKKNGYSVKYVENRLRAALEDFWKYRPRIDFPYYNSVIVFRHLYTWRTNAWEHCVPADSEVDCVIRLIFVYVLHQMFQISFRHYHCCSIGEEEHTEVYVMPISDFDKWLAQETPYLAVTPNRGKLYKCPADARKARIQAEEDT